MLHLYHPEESMNTFISTFFYFWEKKRAELQPQCYSKHGFHKISSHMFISLTKTPTFTTLLHSALHISHISWRRCAFLAPAIQIRVRQSSKLLLRMNISEVKMLLEAGDTGGPSTSYRPGFFIFFERAGWSLSPLAANRKWVFFALVDRRVWVSRKRLASAWMKSFVPQDEYQHCFPLTTQRTFGR